MKLIEYIDENYLQNHKKLFSILIFGLFLLFFILSLIFLNKVIDDSLDNPLENEKDYDKYFYFNDEQNNTKENENNNLNIDNSNECENTKSLIMKQNLSLISIFELKTDTIHSLSGSLKAFNIIMLIFAVFIFLIIPTEKEETKGLDCCSQIFYEICFTACEIFCFSFFLILFGISLLVEIILFSVLCGKYNYSGMNDFLQFLKCNNINKDAFEEYMTLNDFSYHILLLKIFHSFYIIYSFIFIFLSFICFKEPPKIKKKEDGKDDIINSDDKKIALNN